MSLSTLLGLATVLAATAPCVSPEPAAAVSPALAAAITDVTLKSADRGKLVKGVREYFGYKDSSQPGKAYKEMEDLRGILEKVAPDANNWEVTLSWVDEWREIMRAGNQASKPKVKSTGRFIQVDLGDGLGLDDKAKRALGQSFDGNLKAYYSIPKRYKDEPCPILALHPTTAENNVKFKDLTRGRDLLKEVEKWAKDTYPDTILEKAIVIVPVMDIVTIGADGLTGSRATWDSREGLICTFTALRDLVLNECVHDPNRIFIDGHGEGGRAAMLLSSQFPSLTTGAIIRGAPAEKIEFRNCVGKPFLFVGDEGQSFCETWSAKEGFNITHISSLDDFSLTDWLSAEGNAKNPLPEKVELRTDDLTFGAAYWLRISDMARVENVRTAEIIAEVDREQNTITVTTNPRVASFYLYLNDSLVDLDKEITVVHKLAGEEEAKIAFQGTKKRVLERLLDEFYYRAHGNTGEVFVETIRIEL